MQLPVMQMWSAQYPPFNFGPKGFSLTSFYYYNTYWQPPLAHLWWLECARMGNRDQEQCIMPDCYAMGDFESYYRHNGWLCLAGGATDLEYFIYDHRTEAGVKAMSFFGGLSNRYGRLLAEVKPARKKVGFFIPFENIVYRIEHCYEMAYPFMDMLQAKVDVEPVCAEELSAQSIRRYEAIVLAKTTWLRKSSVDLLADYIKAGGKVILGKNVAKEIDIPGAVRLDVEIGGGWINEYGKPERIEAVRKALEPYTKPVVECDDPYVVVRRFQADGMPSIWLTHTQTGEEYFTLWQISKKRIEGDLNEKAAEYGYGKEMIAAKIRLADNGSIPIDVFAGKPLPVKRENGRMEIAITLPKWEGMLVAFLPEQPKAIELSAPKEVRPGQEVKLDAFVMGGNGTVDAPFPLHLKVTDPSGKQSREYTCRLLARNGQATHKFIFARNDVPGMWKLEMEDPTSSLTADLEVKLVAAGQ
jgi:hypothetical protein